MIKRLAFSTLVILIILTPVFLTSGSINKTSNSPKDNTVMITNLKGNSGGTGVVLFSNPTKSVILTNRHVCGLAKQTAIVHSPLGGDATVVSYRTYGKHDLCVITVFADLHAHADISETPPKPGDRVMVSGHPHLLPRSETFGSISGRHTIGVMDGSRPCTDEDRANPQLGFFCAVFGILPTAHMYESQSASAFISPGNSGSQVINEDNKIVGLVFAGGGDPSWAELVPHEYIIGFMDELHKSPNTDEQYPDSNIDIGKQ